jgi:hypothetical protein
MSNQSPKRAFGSSAKKQRKEVNLDIATARNMLPLVMSIVQDIVVTQQKLSKLQPEQENLERHRRDLVWQERERRYQVEDELQAAEKKLKDAVTELRGLGLALLDGEKGCVAFPTRINGRSAVFSWQPGEEHVLFWSYEEEELRRPIPGDWNSGTPLRMKSK